MTEAKLIKIFVSVDDFMQNHERYLRKLKSQEGEKTTDCTKRKVRPPGQELGSLQKSHQRSLGRNLCRQRIHQ